MLKHVRRIFVEARSIANSHGLSLHLESGGKHQRFVIKGESGRYRIHPVSGTPKDSCESVVRKALIDIKKKCKELT